MSRIKNFTKYTVKDFGLPYLFELQKNSYQLFWEKGLRELFNEIFPVEDFTGKLLELRFSDFRLEDSKTDDIEAKERNLSYEAPLRARFQLVLKETKEIKEQELFLGDIPLMTPRGTFIVNGVERVVISQLIRSPGVFFTSNFIKGKRFFGANVIPYRGAWLEFDMDANGAIHVKVDRKRKIAATSFLRFFGLETDQEILAAFSDLAGSNKMNPIVETLKRDLSKNQGEAMIEIYKRIRPGDLATVDNARQLLEAMFFNLGRYDLSHVGRWKISQRLHISPVTRKYKEKPVQKSDIALRERMLDKEDIVDILREIIRLRSDPLAKPDNIDHLGNRRVRAVGELLQNRLRVGLTRMERIIRDRMSTLDVYTMTPAQVVNARPFIAAVKEFFTSSQLSQFMDNENPLAELEHKRRLSAMGPGGLTRERAGFEVRDVQPSHYGRICPIQTPEGPNIGLVEYLASYARVNEFGFIETPYRVVKNGKIRDEVHYLNAFEEEKYNIAHANVALGAEGRIVDELVEARVKGEPSFIARSEVDYIDVSPQQIVSIATSLIPFLEHDDANRALMGSNMQRQAVPLISPEPPLVATGIERKAAYDSGQVIVSEFDGKVTRVDASAITVKGGGKEKTYKLRKFARSNQYTSINHKPIVGKGDSVKGGDPLADGPAISRGQLSLGRNVLVAFMPWRGLNFEDAIIISERIVQDDYFTSIHIEDFSCDVRETKLGSEVTTPDIPNVGEEKLKDLDEEGIVRVGAEVGPGDILIGKISPKGEVDLTPEERLLRAIFGEKARDVKDSSLLLPHGKRGRVVSVKIFSRELGDRLLPGVIKRIQVEVAHLRRVSIGDKLSGRHGNKGVIAQILSEEDMPFLEDGTPVEVILNPLGVISRMNVGQTLETHLGWAAHTLGYQAITPVFSGATEEEIKAELKRAGGLRDDGKVTLYDGYNGEPLEDNVTVGYMYMMKLIHMVEDKIHMRSIGPYSLITQQPLGGKAQFGGQRFGEMEVWALEGHGAAHILQEMLTYKSDDVSGRAAVYEAIIRGREIQEPHIPASFNVLANELKAIGLDVELVEGKEFGEWEGASSGGEEKTDVILSPPSKENRRSSKNKRK